MGIFDRFRGGVPPQDTQPKPDTELNPNLLGEITTVDHVDNSTEERAVLKEGVTLGSADLEQHRREWARNEKELDQLLHTAEVSRSFQNEDGSEYARRDYKYTQTPDGRLHSTECRYTATPEHAEGSSKVTSIVEERQIDANGRVTEYARTEIGLNNVSTRRTEQLTYDEDGDVTKREYTREEDGEVVYKTETQIDPDNDKGTVFKVLLNTREGVQPGYTDKNDANADKFKNTFHSAMISLLEA